MVDWNERAIAELDRRPGDWEVLAGDLTPRARVPECGAYPTARAAHDALLGAGFEVTSRFIPLPPLGHLFDLTTLLRYAKGSLMVVLIQRLPSGS
jgi:hypothetical protein